MSEPTHGTVRKSKRTVTAAWHSEHNKSKATSSLLPSVDCKTRKDKKNYKTKQEPNTKISQAI